MEKIKSETLLRDVYLLLQKCSTELENLVLPNHLQLSLFVPLPLRAPGSSPVEHIPISSYCYYLYVAVEVTLSIYILSYEELLYTEKHTK